MLDSFFDRLQELPKICLVSAVINGSNGTSLCFNVKREKYVLRERKRISFVDNLKNIGKLEKDTQQWPFCVQRKTILNKVTHFEVSSYFLKKFIRKKYSKQKLWNNKLQNGSSRLKISSGLQK